MLVDVDDAVVEEARAANARIEAMLAGGSPTGAATVDVDEVRRIRAQGGAGFPAPVRLDHALDRHIDGPACSLRLRFLVPPVVRGAYLFLHGGGWWNGGADEHDLALWALAEAAEVAVVSADYRLAPEHPFPAAIDDCEAVARWCLDHLAAEVGTSSLVLGGDSAGAHLALATLLRLRDRHDAATAIAAADLVFGIYDLSLTPSVRAWDGRRLLLDRRTIEWFVEAFTPGWDPERRRHPDVSPLYADLRGLPPALVTVGTLDPLLDDSLFLAARWQAAGGAARLRVWPEGIHGFTTLGTDLAGAAEAERADHVRLACAPTAAGG